MGGSYLNLFVKVGLSLDPILVTDADAFHVFGSSFSAKQNEKGFLIIHQKRALPHALKGKKKEQAAPLMKGKVSQ